jgi:hypothetical protein
MPPVASSQFRPRYANNDPAGRDYAGPDGRDPASREPANREPARREPANRDYPARDYAGKDYADHGYWEDKQRDAARTSQRQIASADHTGSWRVAEKQLIPVAPAGPMVDGFYEDRDFPAVLWWTAIWYTATLLLYVLLAVVLSTSGMRSHALHALISDALGAFIAIAISLGVAAFVRQVTLAWRAITVGFGAAVVGAGIATLLFSLF